MLNSVGRKCLVAIRGLTTFGCFNSMIPTVTLYTRNNSTALSSTTSTVYRNRMAHQIRLRRAVLLDRFQRWEATQALQLVLVI